MLQQIMTAPHTITFREVPIPAPGPNEALIRILRIGILLSYHIWHCLPLSALADLHHDFRILRAFGSCRRSCPDNRPLL